MFLPELRNGPFPDLTRFGIPLTQVPHGFRLDAKVQSLDGLLSAQVSSDALDGVGGGGSGWAGSGAPITAYVVTSGRLEFARAGRRHGLTPGQVCVRDTGSAWSFSCTPAAEFRLVSVPRHLVLSYPGSSEGLDEVRVLEAEDPRGRVLEEFLERMETFGNNGNATAPLRALALDVCALILANILVDGRVRHPANAPMGTLSSAKDAIERNIGNADLSPSIVADLIGVSPRTLHRAFSASDDTVMAFIRRTRLRRAHDDLVSPGRGLGVTEIATRWHFSDASHFIRHFKSVYGATPRAYLRNLHGAAGPEA
ncbi:helix-turn-helix domain-containing protein [Streptomyces sp. NBC_00696]|uniref:helix-turn-helix domain-containing protein n=1 Tax=Streptomyces sp. NBC_00696 TaxID=2903672 RepID=UPI002E330350|nr:helix-turn-helix domain-containing protein [Streptomyces sp. NBC_00696]